MKYVILGSVAFWAGRVWASDGIQFLDDVGNFIDSLGAPATVAFVAMALGLVMTVVPKLRVILVPVAAVLGQLGRVFTKAAEFLRKVIPPPQSPLPPVGK